MLGSIWFIRQFNSQAIKPMKRVRTTRTPTNFMGGQASSVWMNYQVESQYSSGSPGSEVEPSGKMMPGSMREVQIWTA